MPELTPNIGLEKPTDNETADIQIINKNMDKIDEGIKGVKDQVEDLDTATQTSGGLMAKEDKVKLDGVEAGANKYTHPSTHSIDMITESSTHKKMTAAERSKLAGVDENANNYTHPSTHPANMISQDSTHRFVTDGEKSAWSGKQDPLSGNITGHYHASDRAWANITGKPSSLPANGGNSDTVDGKHASGTLATSEKSNLVAAINEVFTDVDNGKDTIASAITDMGQGAAGSDSFATLANKIKDISSDATAAEGNVLSGKTFYKGSKRTGTMPNRGTVNGTITTQGGQYTIPSGYHSGSGKITASFANMISSNIREGVNIGGVVGSLIEGMKIASGTVMYDGGSVYIELRNDQSYMYYLYTVSGLAFRPKIIFLSNQNPMFYNYVGGLYTIYREYMEHEVGQSTTGSLSSDGVICDNSAKSHSALSINVGAYKVAGTYVNDTGFRLPGKASSSSSYWIAIG